MATVTVKANVVMLDRATHIYFEQGNAFAAFGLPKSIAEAAAILAAYGDDQITVQFNTSDQYAAQDLKTYSRRIAKIAETAGYTVGDFAPQIIDGFVSKVVRVATMTRIS